MYYLAKIAQACGLVVILAGFLARFPNLMNTKILAMGLMIFLFGWIVQRFLLK